MSKGYVSMLLDASGSMQGQEERVVDATNEYLDSLKVEDGNVKVAIRLFDSQRFEVIRDEHLKEIEKLTIDDYVVGMRTPLYDSMAKAIGLTEKAARKRKVVFLVDTDGLENASRETSIEELEKLIDKKQKEGWQFIFAASNVDAWQASAGMGIRHVANYGAENRVRAHASMGASTADFLFGRTSQIELATDDVLETTKEPKMGRTRDDDK